MKPHDQQTDHQWKMQFTSTARCIPLVRSQVGKTLQNQGYQQDDIDRVLLVCSELAANAVQHAYRPGRRFEVRITTIGADCLIEVSDGSGSPPQRKQASSDDEHGRGLQLVAAVAEETGHYPRRPIGKTVWARVLLTSPGGAAGGWADDADET